MKNVRLDLFFFLLLIGAFSFEVKRTFMLKSAHTFASLDTYDLKKDIANCNTVFKTKMQ
jgi:hypothetical protein